MKCEYCDNPVPNGVTRCPSCGAAIKVDLSASCMITGKKQNNYHLQIRFLLIPICT